MLLRGRGAAWAAVLAALGQRRRLHGLLTPGKVLFESELERLGVLFKNSRPYHPQTCGKVERLHQTLKRYLAKQTPARTLQELQGQLDAFAHYYNHIRPHRALDGRTPLQAYSARVK